MCSGIAKYFVIHECVPYWSYQLIKLEFTVKMCYKVKRINLAQIERARVGLCCILDHKDSNGFLDFKLSPCSECCMLSYG